MFVAPGAAGELAQGFSASANWAGIRSIRRGKAGRAANHQRKMQSLSGCLSLD